MRNRDIMPNRRRRGLTPYDIFDDFFNRQIESMFNTDFLTGFDNQIKADIKETDNGYQIEAEMPGFDKKDIEVELVDDHLTISAKRDEAMEEEGEDYIRKERSYGRVSRCFVVPGIEHEDVTAEYKNGILSITLPKSKESRRRGRRINIK